MERVLNLLVLTLLALQIWAPTYPLPYVFPEVKVLGDDGSERKVFFRGDLAYIKLILPRSSYVLLAVKHEALNGIGSEVKVIFKGEMGAGERVLGPFKLIKPGLRRLKLYTDGMLSCSYSFIVLPLPKDLKPHVCRSNASSHLGIALIVEVSVKGIRGELYATASGINSEGVRTLAADILKCVFKVTDVNITDVWSQGPGLYKVIFTAGVPHDYGPYAVMIDLRGIYVSDLMVRAGTGLYPAAAYPKPTYSDDVKILWEVGGPGRIFIAYFRPVNL